jgi:hypothetical protein
VACLLKARIVKPAETAVARTRPCKHLVTAVCRDDRGNATIEESTVLEAVTRRQPVNIQQTEKT